MKINEALKQKLDEVAEIAGYIWQKGWAERNAGNISINVTDIIGDENKSLPALSRYPLPRDMKELAGNCFFVTGTLKLMRNVGKNPLKNGSFVRVAPDGSSYDVIGPENIKPTSELPSHFSIHVFLKKKNSSKKVVLHTHPTELTALSHVIEFKDEKRLNEMLWKMHPEVFIVVPRGLGMVPYEVPGTLELADLTVKALENHDFAVWEKHGVLGVGEELVEIFDLLDTLNKSAIMYGYVKACGHQPEGLTQAQLDGLIKPFNIKL